MKKGNKGFSLVEVMIAITILAIIVTPFLSSFLRATKTNAKSRKIFRATTAAENVMEGLSGFLIEDISKQFNDIYYQQKFNPDGTPVVDGSGNPVLESQFLILNNRSGEDTITHMELGADKSVNAGYFSQKPGNIYEYALLNVTEDKHKFDIKVTVDANKYRDVTAEKLQVGQDYNIAAGKMFNVAEMNPKTDIVWAEPEGMEARYKDDFIAGIPAAVATMGGAPGYQEQKKAEYTEAVKNDPNFLQHCSRRFHLYIDEEQVTPIVHLNYEPLNLEIRLESSEKYFPGITDPTRRKNLKNIYLCYYPKYDLIKDVIQIQDFTGFNRYYEEGVFPSLEDYHYNIYIIKQEKDSSSNYKETNYKVDLNIYTSVLYIKYFFGDVDLGIDEEYSYPFTIRGNLGHYFEKENPAPGEPQGLIPNQVNFQQKYGIEENPDLPYTLATPLSDDILEKMDIYGKVIRYSGVDRSTKNLIYNTTVDVYEAGACTINADGTYSFDESKHVAKLDSEQAEIE